jgi:hypothetical protein
MQISLDLNGGTYNIFNMYYGMELCKGLMCKLYWVAHYAIDIV